MADQVDADARRPNVARWSLVGFAVAMATGVLVYRLLIHGRLEQTAALYVGLPTVLAILLVLFVPARSATGLIMLGLTFALLMSLLVLREGVICVLMAAPIFYLVGFLVGALVDLGRRRGQDRPRRRGGSYGLLALPFLMMSLEGVHERLSFPRAEAVAVERVVAADAAAVERAIGQAPSFDAELPTYLGLGFPRPISAAGSGLQPGDRRAVGFSADGRVGELVLEVAERGPSFARFHAVSDASMIGRWLTWREAVVEWQSLGVARTAVRWTLRYERRLDPAWYFGPWERYAVGLAAEYLIDTVATPRPRG